MKNQFDNYQRFEKIYKNFTPIGNMFLLEKEVLVSEEKIISKYLKAKTENIIDIGCGFGRFFNFFINKYQNVNIFGFEKDYFTALACKKKFIEEKGVQVFNNNFLKSQNYKLNTDVCLCMGNTIGAFFSFNERILLFKKIFELLGRDGLFFIDFRDFRLVRKEYAIIEQFIEDDGFNFIQKGLDVNNKKDCAQFYPDKEKLSKILKSIGFLISKSIKIEGSILPREIIIAKKL